MPNTFKFTIEDLTVISHESLVVKRALDNFESLVKPNFGDITSIEFIGASEPCNYLKDIIVTIDPKLCTDDFQRVEQICKRSARQNWDMAYVDLQWIAELRDHFTKQNPVSVQDKQCSKIAVTEIESMPPLPDIDEEDFVEKLENYSNEFEHLFLKQSQRDRQEFVDKASSLYQKVSDLIVKCHTDVTKKISVVNSLNDQIADVQSDWSKLITAADKTIATGLSQKYQNLVSEMRPYVVEINKITNDLERYRKALPEILIFKAKFEDLCSL